ncbi:hypothetical protein AMTRI_Chr03g147640 [Amborella trichopoda]
MGKRAAMCDDACYQLHLNGAFAPYTGIFLARKTGLSGTRNLNKRMIELLRAIWASNNSGAGSLESQSHRHMMKERQRREKMKQSYLLLHSMLPPRSKNDQASIVQQATIELQNLQNWKNELQRRNHDLNERLIGKRPITEEEKNNEFVNIKLKVGNPSCGIDSMIAALQSLKSMGLSTRAIRSQFSELEFEATIEVENKLEVREVEKAVETALMEAEKCRWD